MRIAWEDAFQSRRNEPSTSFEWTAAMVRHHVRPDDKCFLVRLLRNGKVLGLVPLVARTTKLLGRPVTILAPLSEEYNTHSDLLLVELDSDVVTAFGSALFQLGASWDCFRMSRMLSDNPLVAILPRALREQGYMSSTRLGLPSYFLPLPPTYDAYLSARSSKFRNYLKRIERKMESAVGARVFELTDPSAFDAAYDVLLQVERASWKESHGTSITAVTRQTGFYRDLSQAALASGRLHLQWLTIDAKPVAYNLGLIVDGCYSYLKTSYDQEYRQSSPATFLRARLIESLIGRGITHLDFPGEPYEWEAQWTDTIRQRTVVTIFPATVRGRMLAILDRIRHRSDSSGTVKHVDPRAQGPRKLQSA